MFSCVYYEASVINNYFRKPANNSILKNLLNKFLFAFFIISGTECEEPIKKSTFWL